MRYVVAPNGVFSHTVSALGNQIWDDTHFCPASALTVEEVEMFGVYPLEETGTIEFNPLTHEIVKTIEYLEGSWKELQSAALLSEEEAADSRAAAILAMWLKIKKERDNRKAGGVSVGGKWYHSDTESRIQQIGLFIMGASIPAVNWKTMDGSFVVMSQTIAGGIFQGTATLDGTLFAVAEAHRVAMEASDRPDLYDFSAGWPEKYEG